LVLLMHCFSRQDWNGFQWKISQEIQH